MKRILFLVIALCCSISAVRAQAPACSQFCITDIRYNLAFPEGLVVTIYFSDNGEDSTQFINYPYVAAVFDESGDTLATGTLSFFGQFNNTSQDYPITPAVDSFPGHVVGSALFYYDTVFCVLPIPCTTSAFDVTADDEQPRLHIYPNPVYGSMNIETASPVQDGQLELFNATGQHVHAVGGLFGTSHAMSLPDVAPGVYFVIMKEAGRAIGYSSVVIE